MRIDLTVDAEDDWHSVYVDGKPRLGGSSGSALPAAGGDFTVFQQQNVVVREVGFHPVEVLGVDRIVEDELRPGGQESALACSSRSWRSEVVKISRLPMMLFASSPARERHRTPDGDGWSCPFLELADRMRNPGTAHWFFWSHSRACAGVRHRPLAL